MYMEGNTKYDGSFDFLESYHTRLPSSEPEPVSLNIIDSSKAEGQNSVQDSQQGSNQNYIDDRDNLEENILAEDKFEEYGSNLMEVSKANEFVNRMNRNQVLTNLVDTSNDINGDEGSTISDISSSSYVIVSSDADLSI